MFAASPREGEKPGTGSHAESWAPVSTPSLPPGWLSIGSSQTTEALNIPDESGGHIAYRRPRSGLLPTEVSPHKRLAKSPSATASNMFRWYRSFHRLSEVRYGKSSG